MRTDDLRESSNVEDRRGMSKGTLAAGGGIGALIVSLIVMFMGGNPGDFQNNDQAVPDNAQTKFVKQILGSTEDIWRQVLPQQTGRRYEDPKLVMFTGGVHSGCGNASSAMGPFYCPGDHNVYIDLNFFQDMVTQLNAGGDFAQAYVIAHEVGHHVQNLLGKSEEVHRQHDSLSKAEYNRLSVRLELQADFYAGVWAYHAQKKYNFLEEGDIDEALNAANSIGDDRLQKKAQGRVVPDAFTHGTSAQRIRWFTKGFKTGDMKQGDTFTIRYEDL